MRKKLISRMACWVVVVGFFLGLGSLGAEPVVPGLSGKHPLSEVQRGMLLIEELACAACHEGLGSKKAVSAPDLREVGTRLNPEFLKNFIQDPAGHDPGTKMPNVLGGRSEEETEKLATALSAYLGSLAETKPEPLPVSTEEREASGKELFHKIGCVACHAPQDGSPAAERLGMVGLDHVGEKYRPGGLAGFLHEPLKVRPSGRMPDMKLSRSEAEVITAFLLRESDREAGQKVVAWPQDQVAAGREAFTAMNCVACHEVEKTEQPLPKVRSGKDLDLAKGCLSENPGTAPDYGLSAVQRKAIQAALAAESLELPPEEAVKLRMTQLNCISCHERDDYGGVSLDMDGYFHSTEEALGNESRIPPQLTLVGAKLRPGWMNKVFYEAEVVRPYMTTRMPQYGPEAMRGLTELFGKTDELEPFDFAELEKDSAPMVRNAGHLLVGDKGLNCIACHNYNGIESPGMKGMDLMTSYQRLQPAWFNKFMRNPGEMRAGIIMPSFWPNGKALNPEILDGDADEQIRALWHQFSLGRSARDPSGLRVENPELVVADKARTYRGRSSVAGYRGIAVGLPGGLNYAFNAEYGAFSALWKGRFVSVGWRGQGSGNFNPVEKSVQLAQDVAFLAELPDSWPLYPKRSKETPVNPNPLYARENGYAFKGYSIGPEGVPTFRYRSGEVAIEDTSVGLVDVGVIRRTLKFENEKATRLYFRALTGKVEESSATEFKNGEVTLKVGEGSLKPIASLRKAGGEEVGEELIFTLDLPAGSSTQTFDYAISQ